MSAVTWMVGRECEVQMSPARFTTSSTCHRSRVTVHTRRRKEKVKSWPTNLCFSTCPTQNKISTWPWGTHHPQTERGPSDDEQRRQSSDGVHVFSALLHRAERQNYREHQAQWSANERRACKHVQRLFRRAWQSQDVVDQRIRLGEVPCRCWLMHCFRQCDIH